MKGRMQSHGRIGIGLQMPPPPDTTHHQFLPYQRTKLGSHKKSNDDFLKNIRVPSGSFKQNVNPFKKAIKKSLYDKEDLLDQAMELKMKINTV